MVPYLRIGRPSRDPDAAALRYCTAFDLEELARFADHEGFDGVIIGKRGAGYQLEFTRCRHHEIVPASTPEDLLVFYVPNADECASSRARILRAGFRVTPSFNPYWDRNGATFEDDDGYRVVLQGVEPPVR